MALREVYARAAASNDALLARTDLNAWLSWVKRCRLEPFKKLAKTIAERAEAVVRGMIDNRSNAFAYLRMSKLKHLPAHPFALAAPK